MYVIAYAYDIRVNLFIDRYVKMMSSKKRSNVQTRRAPISVIEFHTIMRFQL